MSDLRGARFSDLVIMLHQELDQHGIEHAFGGALALAYHVRQPRATNDIDLNVSADSRQMMDVFRALPADVRWSARSVRMAQVSGAVKLRWVRGIPVDLFFPVDDYHRVILARAEHYPFLGVSLPFVSATDLAVLKATFDRGRDVSGKQQDWVDIRRMLEADSVDTQEAMRRIAQLAGATSPEIRQFMDVATEVEEAASEPTDVDGHRLLAPAAHEGGPINPARPVCGHWMPRARRICSRRPGHSGRHI